MARSSATVPAPAFFVIGKGALERNHPLTMSFWMFVVATVFWAVAAPWWDFDVPVLGTRALLLGAFDWVAWPLWISVVWVVLLGIFVIQSRPANAAHEVSPAPRSRRTISA